MVKNIEMKKGKQGVNNEILTINQKIVILDHVLNMDDRDNGLCWRILHGAGEAGLYRESSRTILKEFDLLKKRYALRFLANPVTAYFWPLNEWGYRQRLKFAKYMRAKYVQELGVEPMNILVACEESQAVTIELRKLGHNAFSCDLLPTSGLHPEWHFQADVFSVISRKGGALQDGSEIFLSNSWDMMIAHPPCTYLSVSGARWYYHPEDKHLPIEQRRPHPRYPNRVKDRNDAIDFFTSLANVPIQKIAIENPVGIMSTVFRKPDQIIQPFMFGDQARKTTCLWLKGLPPLKPTNIVSEGERVTYKSGKSHPKWYADAKANAKTPEERRQLRSRTFPGIAKALAEQWTK